MIGMSCGDSALFVMFRFSMIVMVMVIVIVMEEKRGAIGSV